MGMGMRVEMDMGKLLALERTHMHPFVALHYHVLYSQLLFLLAKYVFITEFISIPITITIAMCDAAIGV